MAVKLQYLRERTRVDEIEAEVDGILLHRRKDLSGKGIVYSIYDRHLGFEEIKELKRRYTAAGWDARYTSSGHFVLAEPEVAISQVHA